MCRHTAVFLALLATLGACARPITNTGGMGPTLAAGGSVDPAELRRDLLAFAHDSMRGRETGTDDAMRAARFLADRLRRLGLEPAGDSLYVQRVPLQRDRLTDASRIDVLHGSGRTALRIGRDLIPLLDLGAGIPPTRRTAEGEIVFVGYGLTKAFGGRDDYAGLSLEDKVVVFVNGAPPGADSATRVRLESETAIGDRLATILPRNPAAVVVLVAGESRSLIGQLVPGLRRGVSLRTSTPEVPEADRIIPLLLVGTPQPGSPLLPAGWPADDRPQVLTGRRLVAQVGQAREPLVGLNVMGVIRGSDPALRSTYVALGAHYDHIGIVDAVQGDSIANGADDDASGTVALLALAHAMQASPVKPRRSTLFVWHVGEEKGLLGSSWFVDHPTVPIDSIVAQLNADMIGRNAPDLLSLVGPRVAPNGQSRRLGAIVDSVNAAMPRPFRVDRSFDAPDHPERIYERSDHFNYARKGIPIVFFTTGLHADYHTPADEASRIDYDKLARVTRLMLEVTAAVGNSAKRPN